MSPNDSLPELDIEDLLDAHRKLEDAEEGSAFGAPPIPPDVRERHQRIVEAHRVRAIAERLGQPMSWSEALRQVHPPADGGRMAAFSKELLDDDA